MPDAPTFPTSTFFSSFPLPLFLPSSLHRDERSKKTKPKTRVYNHKSNDHVAMSDTIMQPMIGTGVTGGRPEVCAWAWQ
jgi:hypothetical protein